MTRIRFGLLLTMILGSMYAAEEMEGRTIDVAPVEPVKAEPPPVPEDSPQSTPAGDSAAPGETSTSGAAADFNDDASGVSTSALTADEIIANLDNDLSFAMTEESVNETFDAAEVQVTLDGHNDKMQEAFDLKAKHLARVAKRKPAPVATTTAAPQSDLLSPPEVP